MLVAGALQIDPEVDTRSRMVFLTDPGGLAAERYKLLRRQLCALHPEGGVVLLTSPSPGDGKTLTALNLAFSLAHTAHSTCVVDFDFRAPGVFSSLACHLERPDVRDVLEGKSSIPEAICQVGARTLFLLGMRRAVERSSAQLDPSVLTSFLFSLRAAFEWVILDLPPAIPFADVPEILPHVDGALMVVRAGKTKKSLIPPTLEILGSKLWGVVFNDTVVSGGEYYGYYYGDKSMRTVRTPDAGEYKSIRGLSLKR